ncbi:MAG: hypothetical protein CFH10_00435 [Alphaproteobacteria bacterium MarineAlpha4_Bin2]|nr:MAG: hypothetical protein CFH10_00435 [Alphaproteobacteria bacterium MarineAlpha4_Bin2]
MLNNETVLDEISDAITFKTDDDDSNAYIHVF